MSLNSSSKTIIHGIEELLAFEDKTHINPNMRRNSEIKRIISIPESVNNRVVIILGDYSEPFRGERVLIGAIERKIKGMKIIAPEGTSITIIGGQSAQIDCPENNVRFYKSGKIVTRNNTGLVHAKNCQDITAHQNNNVILNGNHEAYAKWNNSVKARGNGELMVFLNEAVDIGTEEPGKKGVGGNKSINPGIHGGIEGVPGCNGDSMSRHSGI